MTLSPHLILESLGYFIGGQLFWWQRRRAGDSLSGPDRWLILGATIFGAALGSRVLGALEDPTRLALTLDAFSGKTIVGALLGGLIATELTKKLLGVTRSTGDLLAVPLAVGTIIGRIGCFLTGLADQTHGVPTTLPWGYDYGDGIKRHPAQLYEIAFLALVVVFLINTRRRPWRGHEGDEFRLYLSAYLAFRLVIDFLKPGVFLYGLTAIQWACAFGLLYYSKDFSRWLTKPAPTSSTTPPSGSVPSASAK